MVENREAFRYSPIGVWWHREALGFWKANGKWGILWNLLGAHVWLSPVGAKWEAGAKWREGMSNHAPGFWG